MTFGYMEKVEDIQQITAFIGQKLTKLRKAKGYSSHENFAYDHDFSRMQYWRIERGKTNVTLSTLVKLLTIHGISIRDFFADFEVD